MDIRRQFANVILKKLFVYLIKERVREQAPRWVGACPIEFQSYDGVHLTGWSHLPAHPPQGTVIICHGYTLHCHHTMYLHYAKYLTRKFNLATIGFDFRHHGLSENAPLSFGTAESWDVRAALDYAEEHNFPEPYILFGDSLGALAAQRATIEDRRVSGAIFKSSPSTPWEAIKISCANADASSVLKSALAKRNLSRLKLPQIRLGWFAHLAHLINQLYGWDILHDGDIEHHDGHPAHVPTVLYLIGDQDEFGWKNSKRCYDHWYNGTSATFDVWPEDAPEEKKWFILAKGKGHNFGSWDWPEFYQLLDQFITLVLQRTSFKISSTATTAFSPAE